MKNGPILLDYDRYLATVDSDGSHLKVFKHHIKGGYFDGQGKFSADGKRIAFQANWYDGTGPAGIWEMRTDGSHLHNLVASGGADWPTFSPNGKYIAYMDATGSSSYDINLMNANGSNQHPLTSGGEYHQPDYSPNGKSIVFFHYPTYSIQTIHPDGTGQRLIKFDGTDPVYSPNGRRIAFTRDCNIWVMHADGSHAHEVFDKKRCVNVDDWGPR